MWEDKTTVKKGNLGEKLVANFLESNNFVVYEPITDKAHGFDRFAIKDKKVAMIAEVKTKSRMNKYEATGFNVSNYNEYKFISKKYNLPVFVFFVDEQLKSIYGNWLNILERKTDGFPKKIANDKIILFSLKNMKDIKKLSDQDCEEIKKYSTRNYKYEFKK